jgi:hypothetical protein
MTTQLENQPCKSSKKHFETENEAIDFEQSNREKYNSARQHTYKCDECSGFHLSALPPGTETMARINYNNFSRVPRTRGRQPQTVSVDQEVEIRKLRDEGLSVVKISQKTGIYSCRIKSLLNEPINRRGPNKFTVPKTAATIAQKKESLLQQLEHINREEQRVREMNAIHVNQEGAVTVIKKGFETLHLMDGDLNSLIEALMDKLTEKATV